MTYRDILVLVDEAPASTLRVAFAAELVNRFKARLTGAFLTSELPREMWAGDNFALLPVATIDQLLSDHRNAVDQSAEAAQKRFDALASKLDVRSTWLKVRADLPGEVYAVARRSDLTIVPRVAKACNVELKIGAAEIGLANGGPIIITPDSGDLSAVAKTILVAWNGSRESARALRDAWPLIEGAEHVHVLTVSPRGDSAPDEMLRRYFESHDQTPKITIEGNDDGAATEVIRHHVDRLRPDLVVMGLYGRTRLQEQLLGGVSRGILQDAPAPIFAAH